MKTDFIYHALSAAILRHYEAIVRRHYDFDGLVAKVDDGMADAHAVVATAWPTAYPVFNSRCSGLRFYFVQDFEPYFHPRQAPASYLAENTYRMGFHGVTAGRWLASKLRSEFGMETDFFEFGSDASRYRLSTDARRSGVAFYVRPGAARRAFELGMIAMELFAARRPDIELHFYGASIGKQSFPFVDHGSIAPEQLNVVYNRCYAGLSLSMTNASLVPHEMLAAGCIPIVNEADHNRLVLNNPFIRYAQPLSRRFGERARGMPLTASHRHIVARGVGERPRYDMGGGGRQGRFHHSESDRSAGSRENRRGCCARSGAPRFTCRRLPILSGQVASALKWAFIPIRNMARI